MPYDYIFLYADDDADDLMLVSDAFAAFPQAKLITFYDGMELLQYVRNYPQNQPLPCLVLLDMNMPRLNGKETVEQLRQLPGFATIPVVIFTTSTASADEKYARDHKLGFVAKPLDMKAYKALVHRFVSFCDEKVAASFQPQPL